MAKDPKSVTYLTPEDLEPLQADLDDHESRIAALEAGSVKPPGPEPGGASLVIGTWYSGMDRFPEWAGLGFTHVHDWAQPNAGMMGFLDYAHSLGMKAALELSWAMEGNRFYPDRLDSMMCPEYIAHPALAYWLPYDEPDLRQTPVDEMRKIYDAIKAKDPAHPVKLTIRYPWKSTGRPYLPFGDIIAVDPYPIQYGPAEQAGSETAEAVASEGLGGKPMFTDLQTFPWENVFVPPEAYGRLPTMEEVEIMGTTSIEAQTHGQKGVFCYTGGDLMGISGDLGAVVAQWRACVPSAMKASPTKAAPPWDRTKYPPPPVHPAIEALKARMRDEKRRHYPRPEPRDRGTVSDPDR